jgi:hypothetical protein
MSDDDTIADDITRDITGVNFFQANPGTPSLRVRVVDDIGRMGGLDFIFFQFVAATGGANDAERTLEARKLWTR